MSLIKIHCDEFNFHNIFINIFFSTYKKGNCYNLLFTFPNDIEENVRSVSQMHVMSWLLTVCLRTCNVNHAHLVHTHFIWTWPLKIVFNLHILSFFRLRSCESRRSKVSCLCGMNDICLRSLSTASPVIHSHTHTCALLFFIYSFYNLSLRSSTGELVHLSNIIWGVEQWGERDDEKKSKSHVKDCYSSYNYTPSFRVSHTFLVVISSVWMSICTRLHLI